MSDRDSIPGGRRSQARPSLALQLEASRQRRRLITLSVVLVVLIVAHGMARGWWLAPSGALPAYLLGTWVTPDPAYRGRALELRADVVTFHSGEAPPASFPIRAVRRRRAGLLEEYVVVGEGSAVGTVELILEFHQEPNVLVILPNTPGVRWHRRAR